MGILKILGTVEIGSLLANNNTCASKGAPFTLWVCMCLCGSVTHPQEQNALITADSLAGIESSTSDHINKSFCVLCSALYTGLDSSAFKPEVSLSPSDGCNDNISLTELPYGILFSRKITLPSTPICMCVVNAGEQTICY